MKQTLIITLLALMTIVYACSSKKNDAAFPIQEVLKNAHPTMNVIDISKLDPERFAIVDSVLFNAFLKGMKIPEMDDEPLEVFYDQNLFFIDQRKDGKDVLFTMLFVGEEGYSQLYLFRYDAKTKQLASVHLLGSSGGDGGDFINDVIVWKDNQEFQVMSYENTMEEDEETFTVNRIDSTVKAVHLKDRIWKGEVLLTKTWYDTSYSSSPESDANQNRPTSGDSSNNNYD